MAADVLATKGARASATMILTLLNQDHSFPASFVAFLHNPHTRIHLTPRAAIQQITDRDLIGNQWCLVWPEDPSTEYVIISKNCLLNMDINNLILIYIKVALLW